MVSKIAVMALVAIIAVPILVGYGLNFDEVEQTGFERSTEVTNVTPLLQSATEYTYTAANSYETNVMGSDEYPLWYEKKGTAYSSVFEYQEYRTPTAGESYTLSNLSFLKIVSRTGSNSYQLWDSSNNPFTVVSAYYLEWDGVALKFNGNLWTSTPVAKISYYGFPYESLITYAYINTTPTTAASEGLFVDLSAGWRALNYNDPTGVTFNLPGPAQEVLMTIDLSFSDSISNEATTQIIHTGLYSVVFSKLPSDPFFTVGINGLVDQRVTLPVTPDNLSVYQLKLTPTTANLYYVGGWPASFGAANVYQTYELGQVENSYSDFPTLRIQSIATSYPVSHKMRIDTAMVRSATFNIIEDTTYTPAQIQVNPYTKLDVSVYGSQLSFGTSTYTVTDGSIMMGTHKIPINGMVLDSIPVEGGYDNRINGTVVNTSAEPATITFTGKWAANVTTGTLTETTTTVTKWVAGSFAWQGIDDNFLMVGLITSLGAFVGLAMYGRKSGAKVLPLLLVCGGAAFMFLLML